MEQTESIKNLIENIDNDNIALPEFQRDFVWEISKTLDLFDSIIRDIFIGAIIYGKPSFEIAVRELDKRPRRGKGSREKLKITQLSREEIKKKIAINNYRIILDGQQRVTSLYRALKGIDKVWFIVKKDSDYNDILKDEDYSKQTLEDILYEISNEEDETRLSICLSDQYAIMGNNWREAKIQSKFFDIQKYKFGDDEADIEANLDSFFHISKKLQETMQESKLLNYYLLNMQEDKFALFFERSNSKGINLKFTDILAAKLYAGNFNLREKVEEFKTKNSNRADTFNQEIIVRTIAYIVGEGKDKIDKAFILKNLNHIHFEQYWNEICELYIKTLDFLEENHYIISQSWMPYEMMLIPLINFLYKSGGDFSQMTEEHKEFIQYWYWASIFSQRYTGSSHEAIIKDANNLEFIKDGKKIADKSYFNRLFRSQVKNKDDFYDYKRKTSAIYKGVLNLINFNSKGLIGWDNSSKLNVKNNKLEDHHIYPVNFVKRNFKDDQIAIDKMESVINRTLIPKITNIKISDQPPSKYMKEISEENTNFKQSLKNHLIPLDVLDSESDEFFGDVLDIQAEEIFSILEKTVNDKENDILKKFFQESEKKGKIHIFSTYNKIQTQAVFDLETQKVLYKNEVFTPSGAAIKVRKDIEPTKNHSVNGWEFWKYKDENNKLIQIKKLRKSVA